MLDATRASFGPDRRACDGGARRSLVASGARAAGQAINQITRSEDWTTRLHVATAT